MNYLLELKQVFLIPTKHFQKQEYSIKKSYTYYLVISLIATLLSSIATYFEILNTHGGLRNFFRTNQLGLSFIEFSLVFFGTAATTLIAVLIAPLVWSACTQAGLYVFAGKKSYKKTFIVTTKAFTIFFVYALILSILLAFISLFLGRSTMFQILSFLFSTITILAALTHFVYAQSRGIEIRQDISFKKGLGAVLFLPVLALLLAILFGLFIGILTLLLFTAPF